MNPHNFIGRVLERRRLDERWRSASSEFMVIYGRRRVGKTELIRKFSHQKRGLLAVGTRSDARNQIRHFLGELARLAGEPDLERLPIHDWDTVFSRLTTALKRLRGKTLIVLDEFQWMAQVSPELPSLIQKWWDKEWSRNGKVFLILCGSYMGFMEREVLSKKSPLFGRRTAVLQLQPLSFADSRAFHPRLPLKEQIKHYLLCGGIPAYHKLCAAPVGFSETLISLFFQADAPLAKEADFILMEELKEPKFYFGLLESLGSLRKGMTELAVSLGVERSRIPYYTKNLMDLHFLEKTTPLLSYRPLFERKTFYRIKDPLLRFWFSFVYPNQNIMERMDPRLFYANMVAPQIESYWGHEFESFAADLFINHRLRAGLAEPFKWGSYWDKQCQIDFVMALKSGLSYLGEAKWGRIDVRTIQNFLKKLEVFQAKISYQPVLISSEKIPSAVKKIKDCLTYTVKDLL